MSNPIPTFRCPEVGESAFGYCENISRAHGWLSPQELLKACAVTPVKNWFADNPEVIDAIQAHIAPLSINQPIGVETFEFSDDFMPKLKVCTQCIEDEKPHLSKHQLPYFTHCSVHGSQLIDQCVACKRQVKSTQLTECSGCLTPLSQQVGSTSSSYFEYAKTLENTEGFLRSLLTLAELMIRPWDLITEAVNWHKLDNRDIVSAMDCAFHLLTNSLAFSKYKELLHIRHSGKYIFLKALLSEKTNDIKTAIDACLEVCDDNIPSSNDVVEIHYLEEMTEFSQKIVSNKRLRVAGSEEQALEQHCTGQQLIRAFGLDVATLKRLIDLGICIPVSNTRVLSHAVFCFKSTFERINACLPALNNMYITDYVCLNHLSEKALKAYGLTKGEIFLGVLVGEIKACVDLHERIKGSRIYVEKQSLLEFLSAYPMINDHISIAELSQMLFVPSEVIELLVGEDTGLYYAKYCKSGPLLLDREHTEEFIWTHVCVNRLAWLYQLLPSEVSKVLKSSCSRSSALRVSSESSNRTYSFIRIDPCIARNLHKIFKGFPKRLIQKKWFAISSQYLPDGTEDCFDNLDRESCR